MFPGLLGCYGCKNPQQEVADVGGCEVTLTVMSQSILTPQLLDTVRITDHN